MKKITELLQETIRSLKRRKIYEYDMVPKGTVKMWRHENIKDWLNEKSKEGWEHYDTMLDPGRETIFFFRREVEEK